MKTYQGLRSRFKVGARVVCVDASGDFPAARLLEQGKEYVVVAPAFGMSQEKAGIRVKNGRAIVGGPRQHWSPGRFKLVPMPARRAVAARARRAP